MELRTAVNGKASSVMEWVFKHGLTDHLTKVIGSMASLLVTESIDSPTVISTKANSRRIWLMGKAF